jgi:asparagine synthase (glutamine-hydrolysing)
MEQMSAHTTNGNHTNPITSFMKRDLETYLVDDILVKVDRASMACSLEARAPFLDHKVIEFAMNIPLKYKMRNGAQKIVLKQAFKDLLPQQIAQRGKQGFDPPFARWFQKDPWRTFLVDVLSETRLRDQGIFDPGSVVSLRDRFLRDPEANDKAISAHQLSHAVWSLFLFQLWADQFMK